MHIEKGISLLANCFSASTHISILNNSLKTHLQSLSYYSVAQQHTNWVLEVSSTAKHFQLKANWWQRSRNCWYSSTTARTPTGILQVWLALSLCIVMLSINYTAFSLTAVSAQINPLRLCWRTHNSPICTLQHIWGRNKRFFIPLCNHSSMTELWKQLCLSTELTDVLTIHK